MIRALAIVLALHVLYAVFWLALNSHQRSEVERYVVATTQIVAGFFYAVLIIAFIWAHKSRLNISLAVQKLYWLFLIVILAVPVSIGLIINDAPFRPNPYAIWTVPGWLRTYIWIGITVSIIGVLYEFHRANWGNDAEPWKPGDPERRTGPADRRISHMNEAM